MIGPAPMCLSCRRFDRDHPGPGFRCEAFPDGIPDGIFDNQVDHREPVEGDGGKQYVPVEGAEPQPWWPGEES